MKEIVLELLQDLRPEMDFSESRNYLEEGLLDSFDLVSLVSDLDQRFGISIPGNEILPENFENIDTIVALVRKQGGKDA